MPVPPTTLGCVVWDAWYGQDAHTSYYVGCVVWQDAWYGQDAHTS